VKRPRTKRTARRQGSLVVVGTGIKAHFHISPEAVAAIKYADKVFYLVSDNLMERWLRKLRPTAKSLANCYADGKERFDSYSEMIRIVLDELRSGLRICVAFYGHPGVGVYPSHEIVGIARAEGFEAEMQASISAEDCLFADLGFDPLNNGCQSFEATDFLMHKRVFDPRCHLVLWQVGVIGNTHFRASGIYDLRCLDLLQDVLLHHYPPNHELVLYYSAMISLARPSVVTIRLRNLAKSRFHGGYTMYIRPLEQTVPDSRVLRRLGLSMNA
jgi:uncharacterized protein YabN with tetrapyrrole methylase and pyrophosphatase domain